MAGLNQWFARLRTATSLGGALRPVSLLAGGTLMAQMVPVLLSPILARLYSPDDYGALAWAAAFVTVTTLLATGTYEHAANLPADRHEAVALLYGVVAGGIGATMLLALVSLWEWRALDRSAPRLWFVPLATLLTVAFNAFAAWANREARFGGLAAGRMTLAMVGIAASLGFGFAGWGATGLMLGNLLGLVAGLVVISVTVARPKTTVPVARIAAGDIVRAMRNYRRFPLMFLPSSLLNTVTNQLPVWFLQRLFGSGTVGHYALMNRVLTVPVSLIHSSVGEVFRQRAAREYQTTGRCVATWTEFCGPLFWTTVPAGVALLAAGPALFAFVFGEPWRESGEFAQVLALFFVLRCAASPLSYILIVAHRDKLNLVLQVACLGGALLGWPAGKFSGSPSVALAVFGGLYSVVYFVYFLVSRRIALGSPAPTS